MTLFNSALVVDDTSSEQALALAGDLLTRDGGVVILKDVVTLRAKATEILCEVIESASAVHRCEEEFKVLVENAARRLASSKFAGYLPKRSLRWVVMEDRGAEASQLWPAELR